MRQRKSVSENAVATSKEESMVKAVMSEYGLVVIDIYKARSAYKILTPEGAYRLKKMSKGRSKVSNCNYLVESLYSNGFYDVAKYIKTKGGHLYVKYGKYIFYVTEWIDGDECNIDNFDEVLGSIKLLANFHTCVNSIDTSKLKIRNNLRNWPKIFINNLTDLEKFKIIIDRKKIKDEFDASYLKYIDMFYERGLKTIDLLNKSNYYRLSKSISKNRTICHDSFYYENIIKREERYFIIDLDSVTIDLQVLDLGKLIRRLMSKSSYHWNFQKARAIIEEYTNIKPISTEELEVMAAVIMFPHKFWKLGKKRYIKQKSWSEKKYLHKLHKIISRYEHEKVFYEQYYDYLAYSKSNLID
jgi:CotS family spore coat protein